MLKKIFMLAMFGMILLNFKTSSAEDLQFIDAAGDTGYYVDLDSVRRESAEVFFVDFIVIRADKNEMAVANLKINYKQKTYITQSTKTLSYDERTVLKTEAGNSVVHHYSEKSLMNETVQIILKQHNLVAKIFGDA